jgi:hypothetical protein
MSVVPEDVVTSEQTSAASVDLAPETVASAHSPETNGTGQAASQPQTASACRVNSDACRAQARGSVHEPVRLRKHV